MRNAYPTVEHFVSEIFRIIFATFLDHNLLSFPGYAIEAENNTMNSRVGIFISSRIDYVRKSELEGEDSNLIIVDLMGKSKCRIIIKLT